MASVASLESSGTTALCTTTGAHSLVTGDRVTIDGATPSKYNGEYAVTVITSNSFTYTFRGAASPASGTITWVKHLISIVDTGGTGDYSSLFEWDADMGGTATGNLANEDVIPHALCRASTGLADTIPVVIRDGRQEAHAMISDHKHFAMIQGDVGHRAGPAWNDEIYRMSILTGTCIDLKVAHHWVDGIQAQITAAVVTAWNHVFAPNNLNQGWSRISNNHARNLSEPSVQYCYDFIMHSSWPHYLWNNVVSRSRTYTNIYGDPANGGSTAFYFAKNAVNYIYNCVAIGQGLGFGFRMMADISDCYFKNCFTSAKYAYAVDAADVAFQHLDHCMAAQTLTTHYPGDLPSVPFDDNLFVNVARGSEDLHIAGPGSPLYHAGVSLAAEEFPLDIFLDMLGDSYNLAAPSIGVDEYDAEAPPVSSKGVLIARAS